MKKIIFSLLFYAFFLTLNAQVTESVSSTLTSLQIAPTSNNYNSELIFTENPQGSYGMKFKYDGSSNKLSLFGFTSSDYGPHITIGRNDGNVTFFGTTFVNYSTLRMSGSSHFTFQNAAANASGVFNFGGSGTGIGKLYFRSLNNTGDNNDYNNLMVIQENGDVGIGTTNPDGYKLAVNGKMRAKSLDIESGWADFVFEDDYKLFPLNELEAFIEEFGHLPEVPSAEHVENNGVNVGETQVLLLQKIEELSLYVIELQKRLELLENSSN